MAKIKMDLLLFLLLQQSSFALCHSENQKQIHSACDDTGAVIKKSGLHVEAVTSVKDLSEGSCKIRFRFASHCHLCESLQLEI